MKTVAITIIKRYQKAVSPFFPASCRFTHTCSEYTKQAIDKYGILKGSALGMKRISKCKPGSGSGYDPLE